MPLTRVKANISQRFSLVLVNLRHLEAEEAKIQITNSGIPHSDLNIHKIQKGLYFVHLYSVFEKSLNELIERCLLHIEAKGVLHQHYALAFNSIALDAKIMSLKSAGRDRLMECTVSLFETMGGSTHTKINEVMFGAKLQNVWFDTVQKTINCFGANIIDDTNGSLKLAIDEVVDKRNAVAHGRIPADRVGEQQSCETLRERTIAVQTSLDMIVHTFEEYISNHGYIAPEYVGNYQ